MSSRTGSPPTTLAPWETYMAPDLVPRVQGGNTTLEERCWSTWTETVATEPGAG